MTCSACGEKPVESSKDFTKAVIEINNPESLVLLRKVLIPASMGTEEDVPPAIGKYRNVLLQYEANDHIYLYSSDGIPTAITANIPQEVLDSIAELEGETADLQQQIDDIKNSPDVVDIVDTYADLQAYDTSHLGDKDIIRVLTDETHDGASSYYRWDKQTETWTYIGSIQTAANTIFYADLSETGNTRHIYKNSDMTGTVSVQELLDANEDGQVILRMSSAQTPENFNDAYLQNTYVGVDDYQFLFLDNRNYYEYDGTATTDTSYYYSRSTVQLELTAGNNITITGNTISATDTTYSNFTGATTQQAGTSGLVPAPTTSDPDKYLKGDGSWGTPTGTTYTAGTNVQISSGNVISATDTTYSNFVGTDGQTAGTAGLVPAPATTDAGKFLKADGTWDTAGGGGPTVVQTTGTSTTDVMSQNATSSMVFADPSVTNPKQIRIGSIGPVSNYSVRIGYSGSASSNNSVSVGFNSSATNENSVAIGNEASSGYRGSVALGSSAQTTVKGQVMVGTTNTYDGYNSTNYRIVSGVHDAQSDNDAVNLGQLNGRVKQNAGAPTTATVGTVGQLLEDTTNGKLYICTAVDTTDPQNPSYTWTEVGAGGGGTTEIEYVNCTLTGATATGFTLSADKTATQVKALVDAGKEVIYKFVNSVSAGSVLAGTYEFSVLYAGTNTSVDVVTGYGVTSTYGSQTQDVYTFIHTSSAVDVTAGTIPTVNDATLTIQKNGTTVQTFTANASSNATANIEVPTITMTTTDPGEGSALAADNFVAVYGGDPIIMDYSTSEINTGATWIDGSAIYKKTVNFGALPNATTKDVAHNISNLSKTIKIEGYAFRSSDSTSFPIPFTSENGANNCIGVTVTPTNISIGTGIDRSNISECYVTLYYTKSS